MHLSRPVDTIEACPTEAELDSFLRLLRAALPDLPMSRVNIRRVFAGLLPVNAAGSTALMKREVIQDHGRAGGIGRFYSVSGVKFTTASRVARETLAFIGHHPVPDEDGPPLPLSPATAIATDAGKLWSLDVSSVASALQTIVREEAVCSVDDLVLRRTNWGTTELDLERVRARVKQLVNLPSEVFLPRIPAATSMRSDPF
jgi:glycerol-3-phosphate dehydrogenase